MTIMIFSLKKLTGQMASAKKEKENLKKRKNKAHENEVKDPFEDLIQASDRRNKILQAKNQ